MILPPFLQPGHTIGLVSTARKMPADELQKAIDTIETWGYRVKTASNLFEQHHQFAGTDQQRTADMQELLDDDQVQAILCVRGGYGTIRIIDQLDFSKFMAAPKWIAGYSDVTVLHAHVNNVCNIATIHSTMPVNFPADGTVTAATDTLKKALSGQLESLSYSIAAHPHNRAGKSSGILTGGNLSILYSLNGSISDIDTDGKILFIEDLDEYLYHIDRMMMNLKRAGKLSNLAGLVVGGMSDMRDNNVPFGKTAEEIIAEHVSEFNYPVCFNFPAGHIEDNRALILGASYQLHVNEQQVSLSLL